MVGGETASMQSKGLGGEGQAGPPYQSGKVEKWTIGTGWF